MNNKTAIGIGASIVGYLAFVEFTSGVLQGYFTPFMTDIGRWLGVHDADLNWLEGGQLMLSVLLVPAFAKLGDMFGHRRMLLISTAITAISLAVLPFADTFVAFLIAWALQGAYVVWLPMEIALIFTRARTMPNAARATAMAAGILVAALEFGAISGALAGGALIDMLDIRIVLAVPAVLTVICFFVVLFGVKETPELQRGKFDTVGLVLVTIALIVFMSGLSLLRAEGLGSFLPWALIVVGLALLVPFMLWELRNDDPLIDVRMFRSAALLPVFLTATLLGVSVLGAQVPLSTFVRTDPAEVGYGLGMSGFPTSLIIGIYLLGMITGALLYPAFAKRITPRVTLIGASLLVAVGYFMFLPMHDTYVQAVTNMVIAGIGTGALVAALPAAAAAAAPRSQVGVATGLTNSTKTLGGAIASCVFALALMQHASGSTHETAGSLSGYLTVWTICGATALVAAVLLLFVPKNAFRDPAELEPEAVAAI